jgi:hypothetical protein
VEQSSHFNCDCPGARRLGAQIHIVTPRPCILTFDPCCVHSRHMRLLLRFHLLFQRRSQFPRLPGSGVSTRDRCGAKTGGSIKSSRASEDFLLSTDHSPSELPTPHSTSTLSPTAPLDPIDRVSHIYSPLLTAVVCLGSSLRHVLTFCGQVRHWHLSAVGGPAGWNGCVQKRMAAICHCSDRRPDRCGPL